MKRLFSYILLLFTALLISNQTFANTNKAKLPISLNEVGFHDSPSISFKFDSDSDVKQLFFIQKNFKDKIELSESEIETEDSRTASTSGHFSFFETYLLTHAFGNTCKLVQNGLAPSKHLLYLATRKSFCIIFCVYRI
ncbi:hypothetical protein ABGT15_06505 [Flavobacterium enshiense]|uniref:hypothetical protein n=1 Tax=Flavobacterium enshiense TaxID=1341165 RepID=UPI00345DC6D1